MAKKRSSGGGSGMGVIITLVFFVLATVILGVTTYFGFAEQANLEGAKKKAEDKEKEREKERNWQRFQARVLRQYMGKAPAGLDAKDLAREKALFDKGQLTYAGTDKDEFGKLVKDLDAAMLWDASKVDSPPTTYETRLKQKDASKDEIVKENDKLKAEKEEALRKEKEAVAALKAAGDDYKIKLDALVAKLDVDKKKDREDIDKAEKVALDAGKEKAKSDKERALAQADLKKEQALRKGVEGKLAQAAKDNKAISNAKDEIQAQRDALAAKLGVDPRAVEAESIDKKASDILKSWNKNWQIAYMDRKGSMPYINLGRADGLEPQVTFSVHSVGLDGRLNPTPKATVEVVKVVDDHVAQVRITSVKDKHNDPVIKGDRLFNATWDPHRKRHIALAGIPDLAGDGTDGLAEFRRFLTRQNVDLDAYIDTKDDKAPKLVGKGVSPHTDYLVLGDGLEWVNHPQMKNAAYKAAFDRMISDMKAKARDSGVTVISLKKYLDMIGYRAPKVAASGSGSAGRGGYRR